MSTISALAIRARETRSNIKKKCPVPGCTFDAPSGLLMCQTHWISVPKGLRDKVWKTFRSEVTSSYLVAIKAAIAAATPEASNGLR